MLRAPNPEPPVLALLALLFAFTLPDLDLDGDGYGTAQEARAGCSNLSAMSFPTCQHGVPVACSLTEPGFTPPPEPC